MSSSWSKTRISTPRLAVGGSPTSRTAKLGARRCTKTAFPATCLRRSVTTSSLTTHLRPEFWAMPAKGSRFESKTHCRVPGHENVVEQDGNDLRQRQLSGKPKDRNGSKAAVGTTAIGAVLEAITQQSANRRASPSAYRRRAHQGNLLATVINLRKLASKRR